MKTILSILAAVLIVGIAYAPPVGQTSEWGIVISPCAWCFKTNVPIQVHHIIPQAECKRIGRPDLIYNTNNMVCLCRIDHLRLGHRGNFTNAVTNLILMLREGKK